VVAAPEQPFPHEDLDDLSAEIRLALTHRHGCSQLSLSGELDMAAVPSWKRPRPACAPTAPAAPSSSTWPRLVSSDSSVIAWLLRLSRRVDAGGGEFVVLVEARRGAVHARDQRRVATS